MSHDDSRGDAASTTHHHAGETASDHADPGRTLTQEEAAQVFAIMRAEAEQRDEARRTAEQARYQMEVDAAIAVQAAAEVGAGSSIDGLARAMLALNRMAELAPDDMLTSTALDYQGTACSRLSAAPALDTLDLARNLAGLVGEILRSGERPDPAILALASSALVDAVALASGPVTLPPLPAGLMTQADGSGTP